MISSSTRRSYLRGIAAAGGLSMTGLAGCTGTILGDDTIPIGVITDRSGSLEEVATPWEDAIRLAVDEVNAAGGPLDRELELHFKDAAAQQDATEAAYEDLVDDHDIAAVLGPPAGAFQTDGLAAAITQDEVMQLLTSPQPRIAEQGFVTEGDRELKVIGRTLANDIPLGVAAAYVLNEIVEADTAWFGWWESREEQMLLRAEDLFDGEVVGWYERNEYVERGGIMTETARQDDYNRIRELLDLWEDIDNNGNADRLVDFLADDVVLIPPGTEPIEGFDDAKTLFENHEPSGEWEKTSEEILISGDVAVNWVTTRGSPGPDAPEDHELRGLVVYERGEDGDWKVKWDIWHRVE